MLSNALMESFKISKTVYKGFHQQIPIFAFTA